MSTFIKNCFFVTAVLLSAVCLAQDSIPTAQIDSLYREDQFYIGATYNFISQVPNGVSTRGLSGGIQVGFVRDMPINERRNLAVAIGAGLAFDQFGQTLMIDETTSEETIFMALGDEVNFDRNYFSMSQIEIPIEFRWRTSTPTNYKFWRVYAGFRVGYAYWYKGTFKQSGNTVNQTDIPEFEPLRFAATLSFGYNTFNFFAYYSINPFFKDAVTDTGESVDFKTFKVGLMFYVL